MEENLTKSELFFLERLASEPFLESLVRKGVIIRTESGVKLRWGADSAQIPRHNQKKTPMAARTPTGGNTPVWAHNLSRRFHKRLNSGLPLKGSPEWTPKWEEELARLHRIDGYSPDEIAETLDFIAGDVSKFGFCFARNIRSLAGIRMKWRNGFSKFATAYNAMMENRSRSDDKIPAEFRGKWAEEANGLDEFLNSLRHPDYSTVKKRAAWRSGCHSISALFLEFILRRKWPPAIIGGFRNSLEPMIRKGIVFSVNILANAVKDYFDSYNGVVGYDNGRFDETYKERILEFLEDIKWN